jgi:hypothetical protein
MSYGNPDRWNKQEREVSNAIHVLEREINRSFDGLSINHSVRLDPEMYYNDRGFPSRVLEIFTGRNSSVRLNLQRNTGIPGAAWTLGATTFVDGRSVAEGEWDGPMPTIRKALASLLTITNAG